MTLPVAARRGPVTIESFRELQRTLKTGEGLTESFHEVFVIPSLRRPVEKRAFVQEDMVSVELKQWARREDEKDITVNVHIVHPSLWLGITYADGYEDLSKGGMFALTPNGEFSNRFGLSHPCIEHGPMTTESQWDLVCLALGKPTTALAVAAPLQ
jgi:hypothetical protein